MKIRDAIKTLKLLISLLEAFEPTHLSVEDIYKNNASNKKAKKMSDEQIMVNLNTLIKLSSLDKAQWIEFAKSNGIEVEIRQRDASRDVLDKILKYLDSNPLAKEKIEKGADATSSVHSPELTKALKILLSK